MPGIFLDSNVLLYSASTCVPKAERADALIAAGGTISVQVLNEILNVLRRQGRTSLTEANGFLDGLRRLLDVRPLTIEDHDLSRALIERYQFATYDGMVVASALRAGCETLWSEDMHDGLVVEGTLTIRNPFRRTVGS
jgi:predicted nucleic acid-binding protein